MKTTGLGIATIIATLASAFIAFVQTGALDIAVIAAGITAGWGLIQAADAPKA